MFILEFFDALEFPIICSVLSDFWLLSNPPYLLAFCNLGPFAPQSLQVVSIEYDLFITDFASLYGVFAYLHVYKKLKTSCYKLVLCKLQAL